MDKLYRRNQILELLRTEAVATQTDLRRKLHRLGIRVTQATVSRDIEELGVVKTREGYRLPDSAPVLAPPQPTLEIILKEFVREVRRASNLVIVKTHPGNAHSVAVGLDAEHWPEVLGTVAGDDTIFIATGGARPAAQLLKKILGVLSA
ncbi:MAG TPA: ArgR family transcriptional regulator [Terriglobia bacterium]|nr:ArgR family transcriptional regulator [Terriglobia bacterium]